MTNVLNLTVLGQKRRVYPENQIGPNEWSARMYIGSHPSRTVRGTLRLNSAGVFRFAPKGKNAKLLRSSN